ncbi:MAG TPA: helix-turn-helix domain-containing protein [Candidatus Cloacimonas sp.]|jgi:excisionase family DNA binding protein|nr:helix-turn-helix domain-containing protein [Candidatus Cloacimonas sp.]
MKDSKIYLNVTEAADLLNVKPGTIYQLVWRKKIPYYKPLGKKLLFKKEELLSYIEKSRVQTQDEIETESATTEMKRGAK